MTTPAAAEFRSTKREIRNNLKIQIRKLKTDTCPFWIFFFVL